MITTAISTADYRELHLFIVRESTENVPAFVRLRKEHVQAHTVQTVHNDYVTDNSSNVTGSATQTVEEATVTQAPHQHLVMQVTPQSTYRFETEGVTITLAYLADCENIIERGIAVLDLDPRHPSHPQSADQARASVHYEPPINWMNDPNGLCYFKGYYHLFYQYNPYGWGWDSMHWGHAASPDMIHWTHLPVFVEPQPRMLEDLEFTGGAFSGSAITVDENGRPCAGENAAAIRFYLTRHEETRGDETSVVEYQTSFLSTDGVHAEQETTVITPEAAFGRDFRDPKIDVAWPDGIARIVTATNVPIASLPVEQQSPLTSDADPVDFVLSATETAGTHEPDVSRVPAIALYTNESSTLSNEGWQYRSIVLADTDYPQSRTFECPDLCVIDGKTVAMAALMHIRTHNGTYQPIRWYVGELDGNNFHVDRAGWADTGNTYYATQSFLTPDGRRVAFGWLSDFYGIRKERAGFANGAMSLPRELHVRDGVLYSRPVQEAYRELIDEQLVLQEGVAQVPGNAYYADIRDISGNLRVILSHTDSLTWTLECDGSNVRCVNSGTDAYDMTSIAKVDHVDRIEIWQDHGIMEIFVNDGESAITLLADDARANGSFSYQGDASVKLYQVRL